MWGFENMTESIKKKEKKNSKRVKQKPEVDLAMTKPLSVS